ncbi:MAG TPA: DUF2268 domain-containing putative Zn-dependent protease [Thermomicrobiales bacterium]|nr:DUF2268 domain-containing putative Zn-dependent protease [Thermomicrobiales bacterium]
MSSHEPDWIIKRIADDGNVHIETTDVLSAQRMMFEAESLEERRRIGVEQVAERLRPWWEPMKHNPWAPKGPDDADALDDALMLNIAPPKMDRADALTGLDRFAGAGSLDACTDALVRTFDRLQPTAHGIILPTIRYTLALANPSLRTERDNNAAYTGFGGNPGSIFMIALPSDFNLPRLAPMAAHEAHHNVRMTYEPWIPATITVGQYLAIEGTAEAFSVELYGDDSLGPWTTMHTEDALNAQRARFREVIDKTGDPRPYMFGDWAAAAFHYEAQGLPNYIGYGMGYRIVRSYLESTGKTATEATYIPWREIVDGAAWLWEE